MKNIFTLVLIALTIPLISIAQTRPRLAVVIAFDQLRSDQIVRHLEEFQDNGFRLFFTKGAVAPYTEYRNLQNMTCPGHATILSGGWPAQHKIPLNEWYDKKTKKTIYCVMDDQGVLSPRLAGNGHLSDELKIADAKSKIVSVALKDRSAILLGGRADDAAYWFDPEKNKFITSAYYKNVKAGLNEFSVPSIPEKGTALTWSFAHEQKKIEYKSSWGEKSSLIHPATTMMTAEAAEKLFSEYQLGMDSSPDLLAVSFSTHDLVGHQFGPNSPEVLETLRLEDRALSHLVTYIKNKMGGLNEVVFVVTSDHGTAPLEADAKKLNLDAGRISQESIRKKINIALNKKYPNFCKSKEGPLVAAKAFHFYFDTNCPRLVSAEVENFVRDTLKAEQGVEEVLFTSANSAKHWPAFFAKSMEVSYVEGRSGDFILVPKPYWYIDEGPPSNHMTSYSYDRYVPLLFLGKNFRKIQSYQRTEVVDLAPTLAAVLKITPPAQSQGRILHELLAE